jgi:hypothetical protein
LCPTFVASSLLIRVVDGLPSRYPRYRVAVSLATWGTDSRKDQGDPSVWRYQWENYQNGSCQRRFQVVSIANVQAYVYYTLAPIRLLLTQPEDRMRLSYLRCYARSYVPYLHGTWMNLNSARLPTFAVRLFFLMFVVGSHDACHVNPVVRSLSGMPPAPLTSCVLSAQFESKAG